LSHIYALSLWRTEKKQKKNRKQKSEEKKTKKSVKHTHPRHLAAADA